MSLKYILCFFLLAFPYGSAAFELPKETYVFDVTAGGDTLRLDRYPAVRGCDDKGQIVVFAFGGGFRGGSRGSASFMPFFRFLVENGVTVVSTDYRTALKDADPVRLATLPGFKDALYEAISVAVTDFYKATAFVIEHSPMWGVDSAKIIACGSSAGAITVLQAEYGICNDMVPSGILPADFNYAGVISMAGAVCAEGVPEWTAMTAPIMLFHGDADSVVPFEKAVIDGFGLWGSSTVSRALGGMGLSHVFHVVRGGGHEVSGTPMTRYRGEILNFIRLTDSPGVCRTATIEETIPGTGDYKTDFTIEDYLRSNM